MKTNPFVKCHKSGLICFCISVVRELDGELKMEVCEVLFSFADKQLLDPLTIFSSNIYKFPKQFEYPQILALIMNQLPANKRSLKQFVQSSHTPTSHLTKFSTIDGVFHLTISYPLTAFFCLIRDYFLQDYSPQMLLLKFSYLLNCWRMVCGLLLCGSVPLIN